MERIAAVSHVQQGSARPHPGDQGSVHIRGLRLDVLVAQDQEAAIVQIAREPPHIVQLHRLHRKAVFQKRHGEPEELGEGGALHEILHLGLIGLDFLHQGLRFALVHRVAGIFVHGPPQPPLYGLPGHDAVREGALEQTAVRHEQPHAGHVPLEGDVLLFHIPEELEHAREQGGVRLGDRPGLLRGEAGLYLLRDPGLHPGIGSLEYPVGPGAYLVVPDMGVQKGGRGRLHVIIAVVLPGVAGQVLDGVV